MELWAGNCPVILPKFRLPHKFRDLLHAANLRHGTDGFTSSPTEGVLRIFRPKNPTASAGFEPANLGTKGQHATPRPPKPLFYIYIYIYIPSKVQPEDGSQKQKHVAESCIFIKYLIKNVVLEYNLFYWLINSETHNGDALP